MNPQIHPRKKKWQKNYFISLFFVVIMAGMMLSTKVVLAQGSSITGQGVGYSAVLYDNSNGLATSEANAIAQTKDGFIWLGGYSGLIRYDGNTFYRYDSSVGITSVVSLYVDSKDRLWIGTNDNGAAVYDRGNFSFYGRKEGLVSLSIRSITEDSMGNIILATTQGLAYIDKNDKLHFLDDKNINEKYICEIKSDADGVVYGCTLDGAFFSMENLGVTAIYDGQKLGIGVVSCICPGEEKGQIYLGTENSTVIRGNISEGMKGYETFSAHPQVNINTIYPAADGLVWVCADNGVGYFDKKKQYAELKDIPMNNSVDEMTIDFEGNLWFVSSRQGVMKIVGSPFTDMNRIAGLETSVVNTTCMYQGELYIGTDTGLCLLDKNDKKKENVLTKLLKGVRIRCIKEDSKGMLWLCTYSDNGLVCYHGDKTYTSYQEKDGLKSNRVRGMTELSDGTIAVATNGGVNLIKDGKITDAYDEKDGIINTEILTICEGDDGELLLGSDGGGIYILKKGKITRLGIDDGLKSEIILRIKKDTQRSIYWIITSNSISYMKEGKIHTLSKFPYSNNFDMYFDKAGGIWILSSNGIYVVNGEDLLADKEQEYSFYDMKSGLPSVATANSRSYLSEDGTLYISGVLGVSRININENHDMGGTTRLLVPYIEADDTIMYVEDGKTVTIPSDCKRLTIHGYALTYSLQNPRLNYYLAGFDEKPVSVSKQDMQPASYTNLSSGKYVYHLSVIDTMDGKEKNSIAITVVKEKAFYEQIWFWLLLGVVVVVLILTEVHLHTRHKTSKLMEKQKETKTFINQMIHAFAKCIDIKDKYTTGHSFRVADYTKKIAKRMGYAEEIVDDVYNIGLLHDIGKIMIPDEILNKPEKLTPEEYEVMKRHAMNGYDILKEIEAAPNLALGAGFHHERIDGTGYPFGKAGDEIPHIAQIIAVADTFDTMNSTRPYRKKLKMEDIVKELKRVGGTQLNEEVVQVLLTLIEEGEVG